jgi:hypothetical protein
VCISYVTTAPPRRSSFPSLQANRSFSPSTRSHLLSSCLESSPSQTIVQHSSPPHPSIANVLVENAHTAPNIPSQVTNRHPDSSYHIFPAYQTLTIRANSGSRHFQPRKHSHKHRSGNGALTFQPGGSQPPAGTAMPCWCFSLEASNLQLAHHRAVCSKRRQSLRRPEPRPPIPGLMVPHYPNALH